MQYIIDRARERSTWIGAIGLLSAFGITVEPAMAADIIAAGTGIAGLIGMLTKG